MNMMEVTGTSSRKVAPAHYILKIDTFSPVVSSIDKYESRVFEASGYKWKLLFYPKKTNEGIPNISLNLGISENDNTLPPGWEINAMVNGELHRFHAINSVCEYLHPYDDFTDPTSGYLKDDCCVFGVEVFVVKNQAKGETLSMKTEADILNTHTWKIEKFSELTDDCCYSKVFSNGGYEWKLELNPKGMLEWKGKCVSLFLEVHNPQNLSPGWEKYVRYKLRIRDQVSDNHRERAALNHKFCAAEQSWGWRDFLPLADLNNPNKGYLVKNTLIVEGEIIAFSEVKDFPQ
ncbi:TRAF-like family protein [Corchorus olitorius]|uniref:TRAF-like family protein n=1 Tax=Corchorus olitorius TaxID=93759 RepID=A0A1R3GZW3_9ROSI|nr:TRAF-like family protein [Corchorus olitorius]